MECMAVQLPSDLPDDIEPIVTQYILMPTTFPGWMILWLASIFVIAFLVLPRLLWFWFRLKVWPRLIDGLRRAILED